MNRSISLCFEKRTNLWFTGQISGRALPRSITLQFYQCFCICFGETKKKHLQKFSMKDFQRWKIFQWKPKTSTMKDFQRNASQDCQNSVCFRSIVTFHIFHSFDQNQSQSLHALLPWQNQTVYGWNWICTCSTITCSIVHLQCSSRIVAKLRIVGKPVAIWFRKSSGVISVVINCFVLTSGFNDRDYNLAPVALESW